MFVVSILVHILIQLRPIKGHDHSTATDCTTVATISPHGETTCDSSVLCTATGDDKKTVAPSEY